MGLSEFAETIINKFYQQKDDVLFDVSLKSELIGRFKKRLLKVGFAERDDGTLIATRTLSESYPDYADVVICALNQAINQCYKGDLYKVDAERMRAIVHAKLSGPDCIKTQEKTEKFLEKLEHALAAKGCIGRTRWQAKELQALRTNAVTNPKAFWVAVLTKAFTPAKGYGIFRKNVPSRTLMLLIEMGLLEYPKQEKRQILLAKLKLPEDKALFPGLHDAYKEIAQFDAVRLCVHATHISVPAKCVIKEARIPSIEQNFLAALEKSIKPVYFLGARLGQFSRTRWSEKKLNQLRKNLEGNNCEQFWVEVFNVAFAENKFSFNSSTKKAPGRTLQLLIDMKILQYPVIGGDTRVIRPNAITAGAMANQKVEFGLNKQRRDNPTMFPKNILVPKP